MLNSSAEYLKKIFYHQNNIMHNTEAEANLYQILYDCLPSICFIVDVTAAVMLVNEFGADRLGYNPDQLQSKPIFQLFHPEDKNKIETELLGFLEAFANASKPWEIASWQCRLVCKDAGIFRVKAKICPILEISYTERFILVFEEITKDESVADWESLSGNSTGNRGLGIGHWEDFYRIPSRALSKSLYYPDTNFQNQDKYKIIFDNLPIGIYIIDRQGNVIEANQAAKNLLDISLEEYKHKKCECSIYSSLQGEEVLADGNLKLGETTSQFPVLADEFTRDPRSFTATPIPLEGYGVAFAYIDIAVADSPAALSALATQQKLEKTVSLLQATLESSEDGIAAFNLDRELVNFNQKFVEMWQIPDAILRYPKKEEIFAFLANQVKEPETFIKRVEDLYDRPSVKGEEILELKNGKVYKRYTKPQQIGEKIVGSVWSFRDVTEQSRVEEALRQQAERERLLGRMAERIRRSLNLMEILNTTVAEVRQFLVTDRVLIYRFEPDGSGVVAVESVEAGWMPIIGEIILDPCFRETYVQQYQQGRIRAIENIYTAGISKCHLNTLTRFQVKANLVVPILQGEHLWGLLIAHNCRSPREWQDSEVQLLKQLATQVGIAIQQAELYQQLQNANQTLQRLASLDGLTQVANRRRFDEYIQQEWRRLSRENLPLSLILCDVDFFKLYNDKYGHLAGDFCLQQVASAIGSAVKRPADLVARYGGEEFAVILPNTISQGAIHVAKSIRQKVRDLAIAHGGSQISQFVTLSLGVAGTFPNPASSPAKLIAAADMALYEAKNQGRDRLVLNQLV